ncbi:hypothetical protein [Nocardia fluminea]|uniref:hypothetical protein n=1 Tax=Nocardia fluminea TaxID=134984 RepID=UPI003413E0B2
MSRTIQPQLDELRERAARRSMAITSAPEGWQLASPFRVVCHGSLVNVADWLTAAEQRDGEALPIRAIGMRADG